MIKKKDNILDWITDKFKKSKELKISGYVLEIYQEDNKTN